MLESIFQSWGRWLLWQVLGDNPNQWSKFRTANNSISTGIDLCRDLAVQSRGLGLKVSKVAQFFKHSIHSLKGQWNFFMSIRINCQQLIGLVQFLLPGFLRETMGDITQKKPVSLDWWFWHWLTYSHSIRMGFWPAWLFQLEILHPLNLLWLQAISLYSLIVRHSSDAVFCETWCAPCPDLRQIELQ